MQGLVVPDSTNTPIVSNEQVLEIVTTKTATTTTVIEGYQINNLDLSVL